MAKRSKRSMLIDSVESPMLVKLFEEAYKSPSGQICCAICVKSFSLRGMVAPCKADLNGLQEKGKEYKVKFFDFCRLANTVVLGSFKEWAEKYDGTSPNGDAISPRIDAKRG